MELAWRVSKADEGDCVNRFYEVAESQSQGVLATIKADGRPQLSNILYSLRDGVVKISVAQNRAKAKNLSRDPRASLHVTSADFRSWIVLEGIAELTPPSTSPGDSVGVSLAEVWKDIAKREHPDWTEFLETMAKERWLIISFKVDRYYTFQ